MTQGAVLVTGAGGFVCSEIVLAMVRAGHAVVATDLAFDDRVAQRLRNVKCWEGSLREVLSRGDLGPISAVVHGAAVTASPARLGLTNAAHMQANMELLTAALAYAADAGASYFVFLSSMGVFEPHDAPAESGRFTETTEPTATFPYCAAKRAGELLVAAAAQDSLTTLALRLGNVFGLHEAVRESRQILCLVTRMIVEARATGVITLHTPDAEREWAWLPDLADGIAALLAQRGPSSPSVIHAGSPPILSDLALARAIADRVPDTTIRIAPQPHDPVRPPMASGVEGPLAAVDWTPIASALDYLIAGECVP